MPSLSGASLDTTRDRYKLYIKKDDFPHSLHMREAVLFYRYRLENFVDRLTSEGQEKKFCFFEKSP